MQPGQIQRGPCLARLVGKSLVTVLYNASLTGGKCRQSSEHSAHSSSGRNSHVCKYRAVLVCVCVS